MKLNYKFRILVIITLLIANLINAQAPNIEWQKILGTSTIEYTSEIQQTSDGGYILAAGNQPLGSFNFDYWIVKLSATGNIQWQKSLGGSESDYISNIQATSDGGYIISGGTDSSDSGNVTFNHGQRDAWIVKLNSIGDLLWQYSYGGSLNDSLLSIKQTPDGGYIAAGNSNSTDGDVTLNKGLYDIWIVKLNVDGFIEWQKTFGGIGDDYAYDIKLTSDNGYVVTGQTNSQDNGDVTVGYGGIDGWIVKLNSIGNLVWQQSYGGSLDDSLTMTQQTTDGGYITAGNTRSNDGSVIGNHGENDGWVIKINTDGFLQWQNLSGGASLDSFTSVQQTTDGNFVIAGATKSINGDVSGNYGDYDYWIRKLNTNGNLVWQKRLGGSGFDYTTDIKQTTDNGFIVAGYTYSNDIDVTGYIGNSDAWVVKLAPDNLATNSFTENTTITLFPNPAKEKITLKLNYYTPSQEISIIDVLGKIIHNQKIEDLSTTITTSNFEKGIYFLNLIDGTQKTTKKFIVE